MKAMRSIVLAIAICCIVILSINCSNQSSKISTNTLGTLSTSNNDNSPPPEEFPDLASDIRNTLIARCDDTRTPREVGMYTEYIGDSFHKRIHFEKGYSRHYQPPLSIDDVNVSRDNCNWYINIYITVECSNERQRYLTERDRGSTLGPGTLYNESGAWLTSWAACDTIREELKSHPLPIFITIHLKTKALYDSVDNYGNNISSGNVRDLETLKVYVPEAANINWTSDQFDYIKFRTHIQISSSAS